MDLLLINSPLFDSPHPAREAPLPPLGLGYLATSVKDAGLHVELFDAVAENMGPSGVVNAIRSGEPEFAGINVFSTDIDTLNTFIRTTQELGDET